MSNINENGQLYVVGFAKDDNKFIVPLYYQKSSRTFLWWSNDTTISYATVYWDVRIRTDVDVFAISVMDRIVEAMDVNRLQFAYVRASGQSMNSEDIELCGPYMPGKKKDCNYILVNFDTANSIVTYEHKRNCDNRYGFNNKIKASVLKSAFEKATVSPDFNKSVEMVSKVVLQSTVNDELPNYAI